MKHLALAATAIALSANFAFAGEVEDKMLAYAQAEVAKWAGEPAVIDAVAAANAANGALTADEINTLDQQWRAEVGTDSALIKGVLDNAASAFLRDQVANSGGMMTEVIVMDAKGMNAAVSDVTSDYWQGDEEKHQLTYVVGATATHVSEIELDESTQTYQAQVSLTLNDATGAPIGAVTVGLNAGSF